MEMILNRIMGNIKSKIPWFIGKKDILEHIELDIKCELYDLYRNLESDFKDEEIDNGKEFLKETLKNDSEKQTLLKMYIYRSALKRISDHTTLNLCGGKSNNDIAKEALKEIDELEKEIP